MIDQDVPRNGSSTTILHWFRPDLQRSPNNDTLALTMIDNGIPTTEGVAYFPPSPPGGSGPHRYTFLLYAQPPNFTLPSAYAGISPPESTADVVGFNLTAFAAAADLGPALAANYMRALNGTEAETSSAETATGTSGVAPTESPTFVASTTDSEAAASASSAATAEQTSASASASATGEEQESDSSSTTAASATGPQETSSEGAAAPAMIYGASGARDLLLGLGLAAVGAGMVLA